MVAGRSAPRYEKMALLYPRSKNLQSYMCDYYITIIQICHRMLKFTLKSTLGQYAAALNDTELNSFQSSLERWANNIKEEVTFLMAERIEDEALKSSKLQNALWKKVAKPDDDSHQAKINARLQVLNFCSDFDHKVIWKQTRKAGTTSLFRGSPEYTTWKDPALACISCTLVYTGKLGSGKSVLLANMVDDLHLHQQDLPVAYFFCRHDVAKTLQSRTIIGSLVRQLVSNIDDFTPILDKLTPCVELDEFEKLATILESAFPSNSLQCFLVVDGLDDLDDTARIKTVYELSRIQEKFNVRLCVSFRADPTSYERNAHMDDFITATVMPIPDNTSEIQSFIMGELETCLESQKLVIGDPSLILEIREALFNGAQGMFLWAALQIETLCTMKSDYELRQALKNFPRDLAETFSRILHRLEEKEQAQQMTILKLMVAAQRPLTIFEVQEALSIVPGQAEWDPSRSLNNIYATLATCGCLVNIDEEELTTRLVHPSLRQFLLGSESDAQLKTPANSSESFSLTLDAAHGYMASIIITYLSYSVFEKQLSRTVIPRINASSATSTIIRSTLPSPSIRHLAIKLLKTKPEPDHSFDVGAALSQIRPLCRDHQSHDFPFHSYACSYWQSHIAQTWQQSSKMKTSLSKLLQNKTVDANGLDTDDLTPLMHAATTGNEDTIRFLLAQQEVDPNLKNSSGLTALHVSLLHGKSQAFKTLFEFPGLSINCKDGQGRTPLLLAVELGNTAISCFLCNKRQVKVSCVNYKGESALHIAARQGLSEIVAMLLEPPWKDLNARDMDGNTPLLTAMLNEQVDVVEQLLFCDRVDVEVENKRGRSVLSMAISLGNEELAQVLLMCSRLDSNYKERLTEVMESREVGRHIQHSKDALFRMD